MYLRNILPIALLFIATAALAQKSAGEHLDDSTITAKVKYALVEQSVSDAADINVETSRGVVQLSGWVDSGDIRKMAGQVARDTDGVEAVSNRLQVSTGKRSAGRVLDDSILAAKVKYALADSEDTNSRKINVEVREAVVELSGFVDTYLERDAAIDIASGIDEVADVINSIDITPK